MAYNQSRKKRKAKRYSDKMKLGQKMIQMENERENKNVKASWSSIDQVNILDMMMMGQSTKLGIHGMIKYSQKWAKIRYKERRTFFIGGESRNLIKEKSQIFQHVYSHKIHDSLSLKFNRKNHKYNIYFQYTTPSFPQSIFLSHLYQITTFRKQFSSKIRLIPFMFEHLIRFYYCRLMLFPFIYYSIISLFIIMRKSIVKLQQKDTSEVIIQGYKFSYQQMIGAGNESKVYRGCTVSDHQPVAIKVIQSAQVEDNLSKSLLKNSLNSLQKLKGYQNILSLHQILYTDKQIFVVTELCKEDLQNRIKRGLSEDQAWIYLQEIIRGFSSLYSAGIVHRDLKPDNIFLNERDQIKIGDLGFAAPLHEVKKQIYFNIGSPVYMAPQVITRNEYSYLSDIWAIGITFFQMLTNASFWADESDDELIKRDMNQKYIDEKIREALISEKSKEFLQRVLVINKNHRIKPQDFINYNRRDLRVDYQKKHTETKSYDRSNLSTNYTQSYRSFEKFNFNTSKNSPASNISNSAFRKLRGFKVDKPATVSKEHTFHSDTKPKGPLLRFLSPTKLENKSAYLQPQFPMTNRAIQKIQNKSMNNSRSLKKILNYLIKMSQSILCFLEHLKSEIQIPASTIKRACSEEIPLMKVCLMNVMIRTCDKIIKAKQSKILLFYASVMDSLAFITSDQYKKIQQECLTLVDEIKKDQQISKYWNKAKQQKVEGAINATKSFLNKMEPLLKSRFKRKQTLKLIEECILMLKMLIFFEREQNFEDERIWMKTERSEDEEQVYELLKEQYQSILEDQKEN